MLSLDEQEVIKQQAFIGVPSKLKKVCEVKPLLMSEIITMGSNLYKSRLGLLLLDEAEIVDIIKGKTGTAPDIAQIQPLQYLLRSAELNDTFLLELEAAFSTFITEQILLLPKIGSVLVGPPDEKRLITENNFKEFQEILSIQNRKEVPTPPPENESAFAREMRLKAEYRDKIKRKKMQKEGKELQFSEMLEVAEIFGINCKEKTLYAFYGLYNRYQLKEKWDQDLRAIYAGADSSKIKTKYWGESLKE